MTVSLPFIFIIIIFVCMCARVLVEVCKDLDSLIGLSYEEPVLVFHRLVIWFETALLLGVITELWKARIGFRCVYDVQFILFVCITR